MFFRPVYVSRMKPKVNIDIRVVTLLTGIQLTPVTLLRCFYCSYHDVFSSPNQVLLLSKPFHNDSNFECDTRVEQSYS